MNNTNPVMIPNPEQQSTAQLLDAGMALASLSQKTFVLNGETFALLKCGGNIQAFNLTAQLPPTAKPKPQSINARVVMHSVDSFNEYVNHFKTDDTAIAVESNEVRTNIAAVIDYHGAEPDRCSHWAIYTLKPSVEWNRWMENDKEALSQLAFCEHLEDCRDYIITPPAADLLKLMQNLEGKVNADFKQVINLHNGAVKIAYDEDVQLRGGQPTNAAGEMTIPNEITLALPPFENMPAYKIKARLRLRAENRRLTFQYETLDTHLVTRDAVNNLLEEVESVTGIKPYLGVL